MAKNMELNLVDNASSPSTSGSSRSRPGYSSTSVTMQSPVTYAYDEKSEHHIEALGDIHKRHRPLQKKISETTADVAQQTETKRQTLRKGLTYDEFMIGLLYRDETMLLQSQFLRYDKVYFSYEKRSVESKKKPMAEGRLILTNHRILFLSNVEIQKIYFSGASRKTHSNIKKKEKEENTSKKKQTEEEQKGVTLPTLDKDFVKLRALNFFEETTPYIFGASVDKSKYYALTGHATDIIQYFSIPLGCVKNVELDGDISAFSVSIIRSKKPCCLLRLCGCCGCTGCTKRWKHVVSASASDNTRVLSLGVHLPPWGYKVYVRIYISEDQSVEILRDIISKLQNHAPDLYGDTGRVQVNE